MKAPPSWVLSLPPPPSARLKLFCFPHAGGGASAFARWPLRVPRDVHVLPVQPPGRENRYAEPGPQTAAGMVMAAATAIPFGDGPFAFFGHSMGAVVAFEVARVLWRAGRPLPRLLIASACSPPQGGFRHITLHEATGDELLGQLRMYGTAEAVLAHQELLDLAMPAILNDSRLINEYRFEPGAPLPVPIAVYRADGDTTVVGALERWGELSSAGFSTRTFQGGHMYLHPGDEAFFSALSEDLAAAVPRVS